MLRFSGIQDFLTARAKKSKKEEGFFFNFFAFCDLAVKYLPLISNSHFTVSRPAGGCISAALYIAA
jgi:hypothetical protein